MKKIISAAMALVLALSISQTAFAAGTEINQDSADKSKTVVSFSVDPTYTVTIPAKVELNEQSDSTYKNDGEIACEFARIPEDMQIAVTMQSDFTLTDTETGTATLPYTVKTDAYDYNIANDDTVAEFTSSDEKQTSTLHFTADEPKYAGNYSDTATFTVGLEKAPVLVTNEKELNAALSSGTPAKLANDITVSKIPTGATIDLNGKTLTTTQHPSTDDSGETVIRDGENFTIKNGTIIENSFSLSYSLYPVFPVEDNSSFTLNHVNVTTIGVLSSMYGKNITVNIKNSVVTSQSICLGIGEGYDEAEGITFNIENSTLETKDDDSIPVPFTAAFGNLSIKNSTISGVRQGVVIRAGNATISNSTIISKATEETIAANEWNKYLTEDWYLINEVPVAALVVGNRGTDYPYDVSCTLDNVKFEDPGTDICAAATNGHKTTLTGVSSYDVIYTYSDDTGVLTVK